LWEEGKSKDAYCFIGELNGKPVAKIGFWAFPEDPENLKMFCLTVPWDEEDLKSGKELIEKSFDSLRKFSINSIEYRLYSDRTKNFAAQKKLLESSGFSLLQTKVRLEGKADNLYFSSSSDSRLCFKTIEEVGESTFIEAIKRVTDKTLDRQDLISTIENGKEYTANEYFTTLKSLHYAPEWWRILFSPEDELIGIVIPQKLDEDLGAINYIGVVPEMRGKGFVNELLMDGNKILLENGLKTILADVDSSNYPMINALKRLGFTETDSMWVYKKWDP
jgi:N-acetylglutamate synthase-like GNAT family acetyltransferase